MLAWAGDTRVSPRTQSSIAISANGTDWALINASPDLRQQILATPALQPKAGLRHSPIKSVVITNGEVDHIAGLLSLRERQALRLFAAPETLDLLDGNPIFRVLNEEVVTRTPIALDTTFEVVERVTARAFAVPGKVPLYMETDASSAEADDVMGMEFTANGRRLVHIPNCAHVSEDVLGRIGEADLLLFDGTTFTDDEMPRLGLSPKTAARMGHIAMTGPEGSLTRLHQAKAARRAYIHINNSNPALVDGSPERREVEAAGWIVTYDGMEFQL
jgi:pyrroloquinoline quinone biosynthesis protein B